MPISSSTPEDNDEIRLDHIVRPVRTAALAIRPSCRRSGQGAHGPGREVSLRSRFTPKTVRGSNAAPGCMTLLMARSAAARPNRSGSWSITVTEGRAPRPSGSRRSSRAPGQRDRDAVERGSARRMRASSMRRSQSGEWGRGAPAPAPPMSRGPARMTRSSSKGPPPSRCACRYPSNRRAVVATASSAPRRAMRR